MTHLAMAFTIAHPGVTSALIGARTMDHLDGLLAGLDVALSDDVLDRIDQIVPPGTDIGTLDQAYQPASPGEPGPAPPLPDRTRRSLTTAQLPRGRPWCALMTFWRACDNVVRNSGT